MRKIMNNKIEIDLNKIEFNEETKEYYIYNKDTSTYEILDTRRVKLAKYCKEKQLNDKQKIEHFYKTRIKTLKSIKDIHYEELRATLPYQIMIYNDYEMYFFNRNYTNIITNIRENINKDMKHTFQNQNIKETIYLFNDRTKPFGSLEMLHAYFEKLFSII